MSKLKDAAPQGTALAVQSPAPEEIAVAAHGLLDQFAEFAGAGSENVTADAMAVPYVSLMQAKTPLVETDPENYRQGYLFHSITGKTYDIREKGGKPLCFLLCHFAKQIVEWGDKDRGTGGLKKRHACTAQTLAALEALPKNEKGKPLAPNANHAIFPLAGRQEGNILEETAYHFLVLLPADGSVDVGVLPLKSTGLTPSKKLMRQLDSRPLKTAAGGKVFKLPYFSTVCTIESWLDQQKHGARNLFQNVRFTLQEELTDNAIFQAALAFYKSVQGGTAVLDDSHEEGSASGGTSNADNGAGDDEVPF